ncbi:unnamed protein product [Medioppia subpectinata]|uniref:Uncharacterized protein n=1 Tax=Medioppia subpectinata TaxID=1979941 RepID=A0A7R9PZQ3_9ACAR|nr:unnamed protein product [Medioppia subpectinata]CAG2106685.1 unnamed protein product [Medioppia subpectinata]
MNPYYAVQSRPVVRPLSSGGLSVALAVLARLAPTDMSAIATAKTTDFEVVIVILLVSVANAMVKYHITTTWMQI